jgi:hypothetical protein
VLDVEPRSLGRSSGTFASDGNATTADDHRKLMRKGENKSVRVISKSKVMQRENNLTWERVERPRAEHKGIMRRGNLFVASAGRTEEDTVEETSSTVAKNESSNPNADAVGKNVAGGLAGLRRRRATKEEEEDPKKANDENKSQSSTGRMAAKGREMKGEMYKRAHKVLTGWRFWVRHAYGIELPVGLGLLAALITYMHMREELRGEDALDNERQTHYESVQGKLIRSKSKARNQRRKIMLACAGAALLIACAHLHCQVKRKLNVLECSISSMECSWGFISLALPIFMLAVLPTEILAIRIVTAITLMYVCGCAVPSVLYLVECLKDGGCGPLVTLPRIALMISNLFFFPLFIGRGVHQTSREQLRMLWRGLFYLSIYYTGVTTFRLFTHPEPTCHYLWEEITNGGSFVLFAIICLPWFRGTFQAYFTFHGESVQSAAVIAGLVMSTDVTEVLSESLILFRCISCDRMLMEMLTFNKKDVNYYDLSQHALLGEVDAFLSHSWSDNALLKWEALQQWRKQFKKHNSGREARVWFDKCCIDQLDIDRGLQCLPIFLAGCTNLVVFAGNTYATRLWCIMELFTFFAMGGQKEFVVVFPIDDPFSVYEKFRDFEADEAQCSRPDERERMLQIVDAGFGGVDGFPMHVHQALTNQWSGQMKMSVIDSEQSKADSDAATQSQNSSNLPKKAIRPATTSTSDDR